MKMIISHVRLFMVISHVTIIADSALCFNAILGAIFCVVGQYFNIIKRIIHGCLEMCRHIWRLNDNFLFEPDLPLEF